MEEDNEINFYTYKTHKTQPDEKLLSYTQDLSYIQDLKKIQTHIPQFIQEKKADEIFKILRTQIDWSNRNGLPQSNDFIKWFPDLSKYIDERISKLREMIKFPESRMATIITFLPDGTYDVWDHYHPCQCEVKFSFGGSRPVIVNDTSYMMNSGDVILFGPLNHSVPPQSKCNEQINIVSYFTSEKHNINLHT